jgi:hypothetical protein
MVYLIVESFQMVYSESEMKHEWDLLLIEAHEGKRWFSKEVLFNVLEEGYAENI